MGQSWILWSIACLIALVSFNILQLLCPKRIRIDLKLSLVYMRIILIVAGILSFISFLIPKINLNEELINKAIKYFNWKIIIGSAILLIAFNLLLLISLSLGGPIIEVIINLNLVFLVLFGVFFLREKINLNIWIGIILYLLIGCYIIYEKNRINKN